MKIVRTISICMFLLCFVATAKALNPNRDIRQLAHRSWGEKEGYPGNAQALAQTTDGFLWIGSDTGLFRFDGVRFERYVSRSEEKLPEGLARALLALPDGSLWAAFGTHESGHSICSLRNGNVKCFGDVEGVTSNATAIILDHEGTIWANTETGVIRFNGTRWEHIGKDWSFPEGVHRVTSQALFVDTKGTLWVGVNNTVLYLKQGTKQFEPTGAFFSWSTSIAEAKDGTMWLADTDGYVRPIGTSVSAKSAAIAKCEALIFERPSSKCPSEGPQVIKVSGVWDLLFDRNGSLWMTTFLSGVSRLPHPDRLRDRPISKPDEPLQSLTSADGLSADNSAPILEDREGNIWVGTRDGLDQFRDTALVPVALPSSMFQTAIAPADGGDVWVTGSWSYVARINGKSRKVSLIRNDPFKPYRDPAGVGWLIGNSLRQWKDGKLQTVADSPDGHGGSFGTWQIAGDTFGTLWAFCNGLGFFSLEHRRWKAWATPPEVAKQHVANMFSESMGRVWVSTHEGDVITMDRGTVVDYPAKPDSPLRNIKAFAEHGPQQIWAGGEGGLAMIDNGRLRLIKPTGMESLKDVTGIVDAGDNGLWLNTADGVIHVPKDEVDRTLRDPSYRFRAERFESSDGLPGRTEAIEPFPKAIQGTDGRIWFVATRGVAWIDPKETRRRNPVPPPVQIEGITANGKPYDASSGLRLPPHIRDLTINYTALSFVQPEKIRFRYKLEGQDPDWREVVDDRQVQYSNLVPRHYIFRVIACNNSGVWNETGASLEFSVVPAFYQTVWFRVLYVLGFLWLLWGIYQLRLRQVRHQFNIGLEAKVNERTRIARELHDTLLQSFQGAVFQFQAARKLLLRKADNAMQVVDEAIQAAEEGITESRSAIYDLRQEPVSQRNLPELLSAIGRELEDTQGLSAQPPNFRVSVEGKEHSLANLVQDEVYRIARELIRNAFHHAAASLIEVEIRYDEDQLRLRIRDDGKGIDPEILKAGGQSGHWGIPGMRERAQQTGLQLDFWSQKGAGTEVQLTVPAAVAYEKRRNGHRWRWFQTGRQ